MFTNGATSAVAGNGQSNGSHSNGTLVPMSYERAEVPAMPWPTGPIPRPELLTAAPSPIGLLSAFHRRWVLATFLGLLLGGGLAVIPYFAVPVRFDVGTWLKVAESDPYIVVPTRGGAAAFELYKSAQAQMLTTAFVLSAALRDSEVNSLPMLPKADPVEFLQNNISVSYPGDSTLMRISMKGEDPAQLKVLVNAVRDAYLSEVVEAAENDKLQELDNKKRILDVNTRDIGKKRDSIRNLLKGVGGDPEAVLQRSKMLKEELSMMQRQKMEIWREIRQLTNEVSLTTSALEYAQSQDPAVAESIVEGTLMQDPEYASIREEWLQLTKVLRNERDKAKDESKSPNRRFLADLDELDEEIMTRRAEVRQNLAVQLKEDMTMQAQQQHDEAATKLKLAQANYTTIQEDITKLTPLTFEAVNVTSDILNRQRQLGMKEELAEKLRQEVEERLLEVDSPSRVTRLQNATTEGNDRMMKYSIIGFSGLLGFLGAVFSISFVEFQKRRIGSSNDVSEGLGVNVIGALPSLSGNAWSRMIGRNKQGAARGLLSESIDTVRTALLHGEGKDGRKVIMVTSATPGEGKTTLATQLAASLARAGRRTLLIDADLRSPKAHRVFELPLDPGLSEVLRNETDVDDVVRPTRAPGLWMIAAGGCCHECIQALARDDIRLIIHKLRDEFDFVIVDSGPVLSAADSLSLGVCVDVAVLSVLKNTSQATKVYEAYERLDSVGVHVLGAVVSGVNSVEKRSIAALPVRVTA